MGSAAGGKCYGTVGEALDAACGEYPRTFVGESGVTTYSCLGVSGGQLVIEVASPSASAASSTASVSFPSCDENMVVNDLTHVWEVGIVALALVWCVKTFVLRLVVPQ